jgi:hypothetical protein
MIDYFSLLLSYAISDAASLAELIFMLSISNFKTFAGL